MIKAVGFDMDHTLSDRYGMLERMAVLIGERFPFSVPTHQAALWLCEADRQYPYDFQGKFEAFCQTEVFLQVPEFEEYRSFWWKTVGSASVDYPFTKPTLTALRRMGLKLVLITNGDAAMQREKIEVLGYRPYFDAMVISGEEQVKKPERGIFELAAARIGVRPEEMVYVGDNPKNDIDGANRAGIEAIWVKTVGRWPKELPSPQYAVDTIAQVPELIRQMQEGRI